MRIEVAEKFCNSFFQKLCGGKDKIPSAIENSKVKDHAVNDNKNKENVIFTPGTLVYVCKTFAQTTVV